MQFIKVTIKTEDKNKTDKVETEVRVVKIAGTFAQAKKKIDAFEKEVNGHNKQAMVDAGEDNISIEEAMNEPEEAEEEDTEETEDEEEEEEEDTDEEEEE